MSIHYKTVFLERHRVNEGDLFTFDIKDPILGIQIRADYLEEIDDLCVADEAHLIRLQLGYMGPPDHPDIAKAIFEKQKELDIKQQLTIKKSNLEKYSNELNLDRPTRNVRRNREVRRFAEMYLQKPIGKLYTKATLYVDDLDIFDIELRSSPVVELCLFCARTTDIHKYLKYKWLGKIQKIEFNNAHVSLTDLPKLFSGTEIEPYELNFTNNSKCAKATADQFVLLKLMCKEFKELRLIKWGNQTYNYLNNKLT